MTYRRKPDPHAGPDLFQWAISNSAAMNGHHLPAAVVRDQDAPVARVVPARARLVKAGSAVLGYRHKPARRWRGWSTAAQRLLEIERLIVHRHGGPVDT